MIIRKGIQYVELFLSKCSGTHFPVKSATNVGLFFKCRSLCTNVDLLQDLHLCLLFNQLSGIHVYIFIFLCIYTQKCKYIYYSWLLTISCNIYIYAFLCMCSSVCDCRVVYSQENKTIQHVLLYFSDCSSTLSSWQSSWQSIYTLLHSLLESDSLLESQCMCI